MILVYFGEDIAYIAIPQESMHGLISNHMHSMQLCNALLLIPLVVLEDQD